MSRILLSSVLLFPLSALACFAFSHWMRKRAIGQQIRDVGPQSHAVKAGTPTMGGILILIAWGAAILILGRFQGWPSYGSFVLISGFAFGALGLADDLLSIRKKTSTGLSGWQKIILGSIVAIALFLAFQHVILIPQRIPFSGHPIALPWLAGFALTWVLFVSSTNSANLTDGLDGLAGGVTIVILGGFLLIFPTAENLLLCLPLIGVLAGFLWMNTHPADLFLGDVGSFAVGGIVGALALANGAAFLLPILAGVYVLEAGSVILQVPLKKLTGKRVFKMSPLHHHFEASRRGDVQHWLPAFEWSESKVTMRFILLQICFVALAVWASMSYR